MSNQTTDLQTTKKEKTVLEKLSENRPLDFSLKIFGGISAMTTIITGIAKLVGFISFVNLSLDWIIAIGALVFVVTGLSFYLIFIRPKIKKLELENASLKQPQLSVSKSQEEIELMQIEYENLDAKYQTAIASLTETQEKLDKERTLHERCQQSRVSDRITYERQISSEVTPLKEKLSANEWLIQRAKKQTEHISDYVKFSTERVDYTHHDFTDLPVISFQLRIFNASICDIAVEKEVGGEMYFNSQFLSGEKWVHEPPQDIPSNSKNVIWIHQRLSVLEIQHIREIVSKGDIEPIFYFDRLKITVKGGEGFPEITPRRMIIGREVKANLKDYPITF